MSRMIPKPSCDVKDVFESCVSNMRPLLKAQMEKCKPTILEQSISFDEKMLLGEHSTILPQEEIHGVPKCQIEKLYTQKILSKGSSARKYYEMLLQSAPQGICPYCNHREVSTLDHFLPKSHYTPLVITPANLVPACKDCNTNKDDTIVHTESDAFFNPYYENIDDHVWLVATLIEDLECQELTMLYSVDSSMATTDSIYFSRLEHQFNKLNLKHIYGVQAGRELLTVKKQFVRVFKAGGRSAVLHEIEYQIADRNDNLNSWQCAMYRALKTNWFLDEWLPKHLED